MRVIVNGEDRELADQTSVAQLLEELNLARGPVAVERNSEVVSRDRHATTPLAEGDRLEIVTLVGGG